MFLERLAKISRLIAGTQALSLVDGDGIPIESVNSNPNLEIDALAAELVSQVRAIARNYEEFEAGQVHHYSVTAENMTLMVSSVAKDYYLLLVLGPGSSAGRARFELRRASLLLEEDLR